MRNNSLRSSYVYFKASLALHDGGITVNLNQPKFYKYEKHGLGPHVVRRRIGIAALQKKISEYITIDVAKLCYHS